MFVEIFPASTSGHSHATMMTDKGVLVVARADSEDNGTHASGQSNASKRYDSKSHHDGHGAPPGG